MPLIQLPDGQYVNYDTGTGQVDIPDPFSSSSLGTTPATPASVGLTAQQIQQQLANQAGGQGGTAAFLPKALKWLAALFLLWVILTTLTEASPNAARFGQAFAGLILFGALYYIGPGAMSNIPNLWKPPGLAGPNPIPGYAQGNQ